MKDKRVISDAELFDYVEGRSPAGRRECVAARLREDSGLRAQCARLRDHAQQLRNLRELIPTVAIPEEWLEILAGKGRRR